MYPFFKLTEIKTDVLKTGAANSFPISIDRILICYKSKKTPKVKGCIIFSFLLSKMYEIRNYSRNKYTDFNLFFLFFMCSFFQFSITRIFVATYKTKTKIAIISNPALTILIKFY